MIRRLLVLAALLAAGPLRAQISDEAFRMPPRDARVSTYWMWMNGNITAEAITADLEYMRRTCYGGALIFNAGSGVPRGPVDYASDEWVALTRHACSEAARLGLELGMHNSPGYSSVGGNWITPDRSMKCLVWSDRTVGTKGPDHRIVCRMPRPRIKEGYCREVRLLAYPAGPFERCGFAERLESVTLDGRDTGRILFDNDDATQLRVEGGTRRLVFRFSEPFTARAISLWRGKRETPRDPYDGPRDYGSTYLLEVSDDGVSYRPVGRFTAPPLRAAEVPGTATFAPARGRFFRLTTSDPAWIAEVEFHASPRLDNWPAKTGLHHAAVPLSASAARIEESIDPDSVFDISDRMAPDGSVDWQAPRGGTWNLVRICQTTTGMRVTAAPAGSRGLEADKLAAAGAEAHFDRFLDPLFERLRPYVGSTLTTLVIDSWEAGRQSWTDLLPEEFRRLRGYDIGPFLLAMTGRIVGSAERSERFLYDLRRTQADLFNDRFMAAFARRAARWGLRIAGEPYGDGNFESTEYAARFDTPMSEFWAHGIYGSPATSKLAASTVHIYGRRIAAAECFTGTPFNSRFTEHPYGLKALGDWMMCSGVNRFVLHTCVLQPFLGERAVMTMGPFGSHLDRQSVWAAEAAEWNLYNARCASLLQQGEWVADLLYLKDEAIGSGIPDYDIAEPRAPKGYRWDIAGAEALRREFTADNGELVARSGMRYKLLVVPSLVRTAPETLRTLLRLAHGGVPILLGPRPCGCTGAGPARETETLRLADSLYALPGIYTTGSLAEVLAAENLAPDFIWSGSYDDSQIRFAHRRIGNDECYFVANHRRRAERVYAEFRVDADLRPELWDPMTGETAIPVDFKRTSDGRTALMLDLDPAGSCFIVFRRRGAGRRLQADDPAIAPQTIRRPQLAGTFTVELWAKPETHAHPGRGMILYPAPGGIGIGMGNDVVRIVERSGRSHRTLVELPHAFSGWTSLHVVVNDGTLQLYIDGTIRAEASCSPQIGSSLGLADAEEQYPCAFEGDQTEPRLFPEALTPRQIADRFRAGRPAAPVPEGYEILCALDEEWQLTLPSWCGIEGVRHLARLESLHRHDEYDIAHFSGKAVYTKRFVLDESRLADAERLLLDLGGVEVMAAVEINGHDVGLLWKAPYRVDVTGLLRAGENTLRIVVTNLYPNRLIGDARLPAEYGYDRHGECRELPAWFFGSERPAGRRVLFTAWEHYRGDEPLHESGLTGGMRLLKKRARR